VNFLIPLIPCIVDKELTTLSPKKCTVFFPDILYYSITFSIPTAMKVILKYKIFENAVYFVGWVLQWTFCEVWIQFLCIICMNFKLQIVNQGERDPSSFLHVAISFCYGNVLIFIHSLFVCAWSRYTDVGPSWGFRSSAMWRRVVGEWLPTFRTIIAPPSSSVKRSALLELLHTWGWRRCGLSKRRKPLI
jgi:hypothetical protein